MTSSQQTIDAKQFEETVRLLLDVLDARSRDIITRRYGIESGRLETLESIGNEYGITRERVRQIEVQAKKLLAQRRDVLAVVSNALREVFARHGGILSEDFLVHVMEQGGARQPKSTLVRFYLDILPAYEFVTNSAIFGPHWSHPELHNEHAESVVSHGEKILRQSRHPLAEDALLEQLRASLQLTSDKLPDSCIIALLTASKRLKRSVFGEWGLDVWVEVKPRGVGDKAYIVLRRHGEPEHFRRVTSMINEAEFDHKEAHAQTVHNELIKDDRFVLVGRGLYGLTEWGYIPGTVADVLEAILTKARRPLTRDELLEQVLKQRMVKRTTVLLGLQNNKRFLKVDPDHYTLRASKDN